MKFSKYPYMFLLLFMHPEDFHRKATESIYQFFVAEFFITFSPFLPQSYIHREDITVQAAFMHIGQG